MSPSHSGSAPRKRRAAGILTLILAMALAALFILVAPVLAQNQDPPTDPPATPTGLSGEAGHDRVTLRWNDPGDDTITGYQVLRLNKAVDDVGVFHIHVDDTGSAANGYVDQLDVEPETNYVYRLKARNAAGLSSQSDFFDARTPAGPPRKPTGLKGYEDHEWVALRWDDPGDDTITGYQVLRRNPAVDAQGVFHIIENDTGSAATEYVDRMDVEPETDYVYRIKARNAAGLSSQSDYFDARTPAGPPPGSPATPNGADRRGAPLPCDALLGRPRGPDITGYQVLRRNKSVDAQGVFHIIEDDTGSEATEYVDLNVEPETPYLYRIKARNAVGLRPLEPLVRRQDPGSAPGGDDHSHSAHDRRGDQQDVHSGVGLAANTRT